jgi:hypothetical protein
MCLRRTHSPTGTQSTPYSPVLTVSNSGADALTSPATEAPIPVAQTRQGGNGVVGCFVQ